MLAFLMALAVEYLLPLLPPPQPLPQVWLPQPTPLPRQAAANLCGERRRQAHSAAGVAAGAAAVAGDVHAVRSRRAQL